MIRTLLISTAAILLVTGSALAQDWDASDWNANDDEYIDETEFGEGIDTDVDFFGMFDENEDDVLTEDEFNAGVFDYYDRNDDERWESAETEEFMSAVRGADEISQ